MPLLPKPIRAVLITQADEAQVQYAIAAAFDTPVKLTDVRWRKLRGLTGDHWDRTMVDPDVFARANDLDHRPMSVTVFRHRGGVSLEFTTMQHADDSEELTFTVTATEFGDQTMHAPAIIGTGYPFRGTDPHMLCLPCQAMLSL